MFNLLSALRSTHCELNRVTVPVDFMEQPACIDYPMGHYRTHADFEDQYGFAYIVFQPEGQTFLQVAICETFDCDCVECLGHPEEYEFCDIAHGDLDTVKQFLLTAISARVTDSYRCNEPEADPRIIISFC
jgi:hypothetical protein